ncbi:GntR family transcriptional regulator [Mesorhizobium amorphae]|uniref:GntR family transcriptional regulator n=1 Tax=Mesorhizobium amorphae TaxID=71433 RepID=UPI001183D2E7|nr:GntR family transcriptional regulator [Mesorhizobium amorphae]
MTAVSPLQERIRNQLQAEFFTGIQVGERINEAEIASVLGVSRTPVRQALMQLQREGIVSYEPNRGFRLVEAVQRDAEQAGALSLDEKVMRDMALGLLDGVISERALLGRYGATQGALTSTLRRLMRDQLAEPSPGRGWIFADVGAAALEDGYRLRQIIEPAAILSDRYQVDEAALEALDGEHLRAIEAMETMDSRRLFELDAKFHLMVAQGTGSASLVAAIARQNNIRRVNEYLGFGRAERIRQSMVEHRGIMAALRAAEYQVAAALMRMHLQTSREETFVHLEEDLESVRSGRVRIGGEDG